MLASYFISLLVNIVLSLIGNILNQDMIQLGFDVGIGFEAILGLIAMKQTNSKWLSIVQVAITCTLIQKSMLLEQTFQIIITYIGAGVSGVIVVTQNMEDKFIYTIPLYLSLSLSAKVAMGSAMIILEYVQFSFVVLTLVINVIILHHGKSLKLIPVLITHIEDGTHLATDFFKNQSQTTRRYTSCQEYPSLIDDLPVGVAIIEPRIKEVTNNKQAENMIREMSHNNPIHYTIYDIINQLIRRCKFTQKECSIKKIKSKVRQIMKPYYQHSNQLSSDEIEKLKDDFSIDCNEPIVNIMNKIQNFSPDHQIHVYFTYHHEQRKKQNSLTFFKRNDDQLVMIIQDGTIKLKKDYNKNKLLFQHQLLNSFSHELKTPLNCSQQLLTALTSEVSTEINLEFIKPLKTQNILLINQINDILDFASFQSNNFNHKFLQLELTETLQHCYDIFESSAKIKNIELTCKVKVNQTSVYNDEPRLIQVLINLLGNSIKYTPQGGSVKLEAKDKIHQGRRLIQIKVKDSGIGMSSEQLEQLVAQLNNQFMGTFASTDNAMHVGLGLTISNLIVKGFVNIPIFQNSLKVKSIAQKYTHVSFFIQNIIPTSDLPSNDEDRSIFANQITRQLSRVQTKEGRFMDKKQCQCNHVLVVDDIPFNHKAMTILLNQQGIIADQAFDGLEALEQVRNRLDNNTCHPYYKLILMDIEMPRMNGYEATEKIKFALQQFAPLTAIVFCSAYDNQELRVNAKSLQITEFLPKPIQQSELKRIIELHLK